MQKVLEYLEGGFWAHRNAARGRNASNQRREEPRLPRNALRHPHYRVIRAIDIEIRAIGIGAISGVMGAVRALRGVCTDEVSREVLRSAVVWPSERVHPVKGHPRQLPREEMESLQTKRQERKLEENKSE